MNIEQFEIVDENSGAATTSIPTFIVILLRRGVDRESSCRHNSIEVGRGIDEREARPRPNDIKSPGVMEELIRDENSIRELDRRRRRPIARHQRAVVVDLADILDARVAVGRRPQRDGAVVSQPVLGAQEHVGSVARRGDQPVALETGVGAVGGAARHGEVGGRGRGRGGVEGDKGGHVRGGNDELLGGGVVDDAEVDVGLGAGLDGGAGVPDGQVACGGDLGDGRGVEDGGDVGGALGVGGKVLEAARGDGAVQFGHLGDEGSEVDGVCDRVGGGVVADDFVGARHVGP